MAADFYPPMTYSPVWLYIGVIILTAIVGWAAVIWAQTRPGRTPRAPEPPPGWRMARLKGDYIERIDEIVRLSDAGEVDARRAHQELSVTLREFVHDASGIGAPTMTLSELGHSRNPALGPVTEVVRGIYPVEFGPDRDTSVARAAAYARQVVAQWT
ncbi:MAG: hypothetical protein ABJA74_01020 [Lapillicoccus sp.]